MTPGYNQFCPVAMAAEILCTRWTVVLLREMVAGSVRFNDLRRGVPRMSPALLSRRLKELEAAGIVDRRVGGDTPYAEYHLTKAGMELRGVVEAIGVWGQRWVEADLSLDNLDVSLLMWDMRRNLDPDPLPDQRCVVEFQFDDLPKSQKVWWLIVEKNGSVDLCSVDPGFETDLIVSTDLRTMTSIWMGFSKVKTEQDKKSLALEGDRKIAKTMQLWLGLSPFAVERKMV